MRRRRTAEEVVRLLREADRDLAKGLTVSDICRKVGIAERTFFERVEFEDVADARAKASWFRREYNAVRPHASLGYTQRRRSSARSATR